MDEVWWEASGPHGAQVVVLVHGSMDRSAGLLKLSRRLDDDHRVVRYDRRGYGRSVHAGGPSTLDVHVDDLDAVIAAAGADDEPVVVVGHSYGGNVGLALADRRPARVRAVAVYETPMSWMPWWPTTTAGSLALDGDVPPADAAERFMRRLIGDERWERLPAATREARRAEGVAMVSELADLRARPAWDPARIAVPVVAMRGELGAEHHRQGTAHLVDVLADARLVEVAGARHFGPNTHPDAVAAEVRRLVSETVSGAP